MCEEYSIVGNGSILQTAMVEMWELLTVEQKKKVAVMRMDKAIKWMELKISDMEKMIALKKEVIADMRKNHEMLKQ
jgi:hypothetical protein